MKVYGKGGNLTPTPKNSLTNGHQNLCTWLRRQCLPPRKFYPNRFRGFCSAHAWFRAPRHKVTWLFLGTWERLPPRRAHRFWRKIRQTTRFCARKCRLGVAKPISKVWIHIFPKNRHFGTPFRRDLEFFSPENGFNIGRLESQRPLIVVVAQ